MDYDEISDELGHFSKWHFLQSSLLWCFAATGAFGTLSYSFSGKSFFLILKILINRLSIGFSNTANKTQYHFKFRFGARPVQMCDTRVQ